MLFLLFELENDRYALDARRVVEVLPLVRITRVPHAPRGVGGILNYRGAPIPVIDLAELMLGRPARARLSTRLVVVHHSDEDGRERLVGLIAERATEVMRRPERDFVASGVAIDQTPYLGPIATDARGIVQLVDVSTLLPPAICDVLFKQAAEH